MLHSRIHGAGSEADTGWLSWRQFAGVAMFIALFAALVVWTTVAMPGPIAFLDTEIAAPARIEVRDPADVRAMVPPPPASKPEGQAESLKEAP